MSRSAFSRPRNLALLAALVATPAFAGDFLHKDAGPYVYTDTANWTGGSINNTWNSGNNVSPSITADQTITFTADYTQTSNWTINNKNAFNHLFIGSGGNRTLTLGGNISLGSTQSAVTNTVTVGSTTDGQRLNVDLGGSTRTLSVGTNRTLELVNVLSGTGAIRQTGTGTLRLLNTANTFTGGTNFGDSGVAGGVIEVTKLADGGQASSIGTSTNAAANLIFGGATTAGTLRYIGSGDSTDRRFSVGGVGAQFDASGTGAINWTNTANVSWSGTGNTVRSVIFKGTSTHANTMSASFTDNGTGKTSITKQDAGRWILSGNNTFTGDLTVSAGTLETGATGTFGAGNVTVASGAFLTAGNAASFADTATLTFASTSAANSISLSSGTDILGAVYDSVGATYLAAGTYDAAGLNSFFGTSVFTGLGSLTVTTVPEPSSYAAFAGAGVMLLAFARRSRNH